MSFLIKLSILSNKMDSNQHSFIRSLIWLVWECQSVREVTACYQPTSAIINQLSSELTLLFVLICSSGCKDVSKSPTATWLTQRFDVARAHHARMLNRLFFNRLELLVSGVHTARVWDAHIIIWVLPDNLLRMMDDFIWSLGESGALKIRFSPNFCSASSQSILRQLIMALVLAVHQLRSRVEIGALSRLLKHLRHDILLAS